MVYHIFSYNVRGCWYRDAYTYADQQFDHIIDRLHGCLPYGIRAYHFGYPGTRHFRLDNPMILKRPVLSLDLSELIHAKPQQRIFLYDRKRGTRYAVAGLLGRYALCEDEDALRFFYVDGAETSFIQQTRIMPISLRAAKEYVASYHRHNTAPQGHKFSVGLFLADGKTCIGVAVASTPKARSLNDGLTLEINRVCFDPTYYNSASRLCRAVVRVGKEMGYRRFVTYTSPTESGASLKASGFRCIGRTQAAPHGWDTPARRRSVPDKYPRGEKLRWIIEM